MSQLDKLAQPQHRQAILLAEIGAWLHDDFKHTDQQIHNYVSEAPSPKGRQDTADLVPDIEVDFLGKKLKFSLIKNRKKDDFVDGYLNRCHYTAHIEKEDGSSQQTYPAYLSSPFGFEFSSLPTGLTDILRNQIPWDRIANPTTNRREFQSRLQEVFIKVGGDTRRPSNEITLWEWGHTVGALYKAALVSAYFQHQKGLNPIAANDLCWRLLAIRIDGLTYLSSVFRLPDLMARQGALQTAFENVQTLLEETYPLATEVYRDENGALYVVPDMPDLLNLKNGTGRSLKDLILEQFVTDGELVPQITLDSTAWWGQDPKRRGNNKIPPAGAILSSPLTLQSDSASINKVWQNKKQIICPICGLRPCVSKQINYCQVCRDRREGRVSKWLQDKSQTIWLNEVADPNGRLALINGTFELTHWLDGFMVETLLVREPTNNNAAVTKTPSFARLRRIWQTTRTFWQESQTDINQMLTDDRRRLKIQLTNSPSLTPNQTYELDLRGQTRMSVLWDGKHLLSIDNLSYTAVQLNIPPEKRRTPVDAALEVGVWLETNKQTVFQLISDDEKNTQFDIQIDNVDYQDTDYATTIPILAEPRTFMALVPADRALDVVQAIKTKYEREMGKVRNRLPLHLGIVYFHRRTPLRAALDAGRRILKYDLGKMKDEMWTVESVDHNPTLPEGLAEGTQQFNCTTAVTLKNGEGRSLTWHIPAKMGDGVTNDNWYPYVFIQNDVSDRQCVFKAPRPKSDGTVEECWLVHAGKLQKGNQVYFTPATLDFQWLDSAGRRFEIAYDEQGRRRRHPLRPYLLDELTTIRQAWDLVAGKDGLTSGQIYALRDLVEAKRENWQPTATECEKDGMFWQFCRQAVANANWKQKPTGKQLNQLTHWIVSGLFTDVIQLYMGVMKQRPQREESDEQSE